MIAMARTPKRCGEARPRLVPGRRRAAHVAAPLVLALLASSARAIPTFTNVTAAVGLTHVQSATPGTEPMSGGAAAADFDGDGLVDLFFTRVDGTDVLYRNTGSGFVDVSAAAGFTQSIPSSGAAVADIDNDGDLDLYVTTTSHNRFYLYVNDGTGKFAEQAVERGAAVQAAGTGTWRGMGVAFGDYDRDGYVDILTSDHSRPMANNGARLLRNLGASGPGHFEDVTQAAGLAVYRQALNVPNTVYRFQPQFTDLDRDGITDVVFTSDDRTSQLFWGNGDGTFTDGTLPAGVGTDKTGMGSALGDYDGDGDLDWFVTAIFDTTFLGVNPGNRLYRNNGDRTFTDVTTAAGVRNSGAGGEVSWGWGASFLDYDNDGDQDLAMTNGWVALGYGGDDTTLRRNNGNGTFTDVTATSGINDTGQGRGLLQLDYDNDGDLDLLIVNYAAAPILYRNDGGNDNDWLRIKTVGTTSNRDGIGAWITVVPDATQPELAQVWEVRSGGSYLSHEEMTAHFGLGASSGAVDSVTVRWPSGAVQRLVDVAANSLLIAVEPRVGDFNSDGTVDLADLAVWQFEFGRSGGTLAADFDGDDAVNGREFLHWQRHYGATPPSAATVAEPPGAALALGAGLFSCAAARRRHGRRATRRRIATGGRTSARRFVASLLGGAAALVAASPARGVDVWLTTGDKSRLLQQQVDVVFQSGTGAGGVPVSVVPETTYQTIAGFGAALTDSSAWLLQHKMSVAQRDKLMRQLFSPAEGIGLNYLRLPLGASDFTASGFYSYNDNPPGGSDALQSHFSIAHDEAYVVPRLQQALALNPALKVMGSPWSAPGWMKTNGSLVGAAGALKPQWEESYALYLTKAVRAYAAAGIPFDTLTLQNEPLHTANYPTMSMSATQQARIIKNHLGPMFAAEGIATKIVAYDHNWDDTAYPLQVLADPGANPYVAGTAFHAYAGTVSAQTTVRNAFPDKEIYFTEVSGGQWATNFSDNLVWYGQNILNGAVRNWAKTALFWNLALDQNHGPRLNGCTDCRGVVTIDSATGETTFNEEFYVLGHAVKGVQSGAVRIASSTYPGGVDTVAYANPDGSRALVALNPSTSAETVRVIHEGRHFAYSLPAKSLATFRWDDLGADFDNGGFEDGGFHMGGGSLDAWSVAGNAIGNVGVAAEAVLAGDRALKMFGQFSGVANASTASQGISVAPGDFVAASLGAYVRSADSLAGTANTARLRIEFYAAYAANRSSPQFLGEATRLIADDSSPEDLWLDHSLGAFAPAGAVEARLVLEFIQPAGESGAVHVDGVSFAAARAPGDFNRDGVVDGADLLVWNQAFGALVGGDAAGGAFLTWQRALSTAANSAANAGLVPEASAWTLAWLAGASSRRLRSLTPASRKNRRQTSRRGR
ncbi:MAG: VCBS repeat-containing protein [Pirellulales bacterium]|nr:VCBS repeat-containing protein [Pirellulales bacterium]